MRDALGRLTTITYDKMRRPLTVTDAAGSLTTVNVGPVLAAPMAHPPGEPTHGGQLHWVRVIAKTP